MSTKDQSSSELRLSFQPDRYPALQRIITGGEERHSLADSVHDEILLRIIRGELAAGSELKTTALAEELKVSRTPVMTALARLTADGIVTHPVNRRAVVRFGAENWLLDIHRMRCLIEPHAARESAGRIPEKVLGDLGHLESEVKPGGREGWEEGARYFDYALHLVIAEFCGNLPMREAIRRFWSYKRLSYREGQDTQRHLRNGYGEHVEIVASLADGKGEEAFERMTRHLASAAKLKPGQRIL